MGMLEDDIDEAIRIHRKGLRRCDDAYSDIRVELDKAMRKFPTWPTDPLHALAVLGEEYGELNKAVLQYTYEPEKSSFTDVRTEALQTAAMAIRFIVSLNRYAYGECEQHDQGKDKE